MEFNIKISNCENTVFARNLNFVVKIDNYEFQIFNRIPDDFRIGIFAGS